MYIYFLEYRHRVLRVVVPKVHLGPNLSVLQTVLTFRWQPTFLPLSRLHLTIFAFNHPNILIQRPPVLHPTRYISSRLPIVISSQRLTISALAHLLSNPASPLCRSRPELHRLLGTIHCC